MKTLRKILLIPALAPLALLIFISFLNIKEPLKLRILLWETPELSIGSWVAVSSSSAFILSLSSGLTNLAQFSYRRTVKKSVTSSTDSFQDFEEEELQSDNLDDLVSSNDQTVITPERDIRDPSPTIAVRYRIIKQGKNISNQYDDYSFDEKQDINESTDEIRSEAVDDDWQDIKSEDW